MLITIIFTGLGNCILVDDIYISIVAVYIYISTAYYSLYSMVYKFFITHVLSSLKYILIYTWRDTDHP